MSYRFLTSMPVWLRKKDGSFKNDTAKLVQAMIDLGGVATDHDLRIKLEQMTGETWEKGRISARRNPLINGYNGLKVEERGVVDVKGAVSTLWRLLEYCPVGVQKQMF